MRSSYLTLRLVVLLLGRIKGIFSYVKAASTTHLGLRTAKVLAYYNSIRFIVEECILLTLGL